MPPTARGTHWSDRLPDARAYKRKPGSATPAAEQDRAAGGRNRRSVDLGEGKYARASITLRLYRRTRRVRAYLRWSHKGKTEERYVCEVDGDRRKDNLAKAWKEAHEKGFVAEEPLPPKSTASSAGARAVMRANRGRDTHPELALRRLLHQRGLRYRVNARPLPKIRRTADVVFPRYRVAVFVDGCFWHGCPQHYRPASRNAKFWQEKIEGNRKRDIDTDEKLTTAGWIVVRVWEHDDPGDAADHIEELIKSTFSK